jgi:phosphonoacetate hydrolase
MNVCTEATFTVNGRSYHAGPAPIAVICIDGCADEYISTADAMRGLPNFQRMARAGYRGMARGALPSFTNVNNCAIVTGTPPSRTGIGGNYILDPVSGEEVMTNTAAHLRNDTILAAAARAGRKVAMVTAKEKLRRLLAKDLVGIAFSSEFASQATMAEHGIEQVEALAGPTPAIYSGEASLYVLRAGVKLLAAGRADFLYLTTTDYMQHTYAPDAPEVLDFYQQLDALVGQLLDLGAVVGITADHGMNAKCDLAGQPRVLHLESLLNAQFGAGFRVICPITDPYVAHHGALGSAVTVYCPPVCDRATVGRWIAAQTGVTEVHDHASAVAKLELPPEHVGDFFVMSGRDWVLGRTPAHHDLAHLPGTLRSHGGRYEEMVPLLVSHPLTARHRLLAMGDPRNFDIFDFVCNGTRAAG